MARVKGGTVARARRKKTLKEASGYFGSKHRLYKTAKEQLLHSGVYAGHEMCLNMIDQGIDTEDGRNLALYTSKYILARLQD